MSHHGLDNFLVPNGPHTSHDVLLQPQIKRQALGVFLLPNGTTGAAPVML
jgi:hypothetical protein